MKKSHFLNKKKVEKVVASIKSFLLPGLNKNSWERFPDEKKKNTTERRTKQEFLLLKEEVHEKAVPSAKKKVKIVANETLSGKAENTYSEGRKWERKEKVGKIALVSTPKIKE